MVRSLHIAKPADVYHWENKYLLSKSCKRVVLLRDRGRFALSQKIKIEYHMYTRMIQSTGNLESL